MAVSKGKPSGGSKKSNTTPKPTTKSGRIVKSKSGPSSSSKSKKPLPNMAKQQKTKSTSHKPVQKKKRVYTDKELGIPALNGIAPAGIAKPHGVKKGKTFVDDGEGMLAILAMVQADKEGDIESKMIKARQMDEIREAKRLEAEKRGQAKKSKLEMAKDEVKKGNQLRRKSNNQDTDKRGEDEDTRNAVKKNRKRVSFG